MAELDHDDAIRMAVDYYEKLYPTLDIKHVFRLVSLLAKCNIAGLIIYAFEQGVNSERGEK